MKIEELHGKEEKDYTGNVYGHSLNAIEMLDKINELVREINRLKEDISHLSSDNTIQIICRKCGGIMEWDGAVCTSMPPQYRFVCKCGHTELHREVEHGILNH